MNKLLIACTVSMGLVGSNVVRADDIKCDPDAKKLEWHVCASGKAEYKKGMKVEKRSECLEDTVIKAVDGCKLANLVDLVPKGKDPETIYFYAIGPNDWDLDATHDTQQVQKHAACRLGATTPDLYMLMKFGDAMDKSNAERSELVAEKLKAKGKKVVTGVLLQAQQPKACAGNDAQLGIVDKKTSSKFLVHVNAKW